MNKFKLEIMQLLILMPFLVLAINISAQTRISAIENKLNTLIAEIPALDEKVNISVSDVSIQEFVRGIANNSSLNIYIDPAIKAQITGNYNQVKVMDIIIFLCKEYKLDIAVTGSIISMISYTEPVVEEPKPVKKEPVINYDPNNDLLTVDLNNDSLYFIARKLTDIAQRNVIVSPELSSQLVSGYIKNTQFDAALQKLAYTNKLAVTKTKDNFYIIEKADAGGKDQSSKRSGSSFDADNKNSGLENASIIFHSPTNFSIKCPSVPLNDIVKLVSDTLGINYSIIDNLEGNTQLNVSNITYGEFLDHLFAGGTYGYKEMKGFYVMGKNGNALLQTSKVIKLQNRTVEKILDFIPEDIAGKIILKEFTEQNSIIAIGSPFQIQKLENFINEIDKIVPLILIEILIVEVNKTRSVSVGLNAGIDKNNITGKKIVSPGIDYDISTQTINSTLQKMNSFGWVNFGRVNPNFYLHLKALEDDQKVIIRSTPKLATLNGHEASLSSGEKKFYKEETSNYIGTQNPSLSNSYKWTSITADLTVTIKPIVSGNEQITLDITVDQSQFTPQDKSDQSPPESVTRKFKSLIRMKNQEMVLLGGLDKFSTSNGSSGLPYLARVPVMKWFFGSTAKSKADTKLNLFIQPTIIY